jgi:putative heme-binding domain-containing protein
MPTPTPALMLAAALGLLGAADPPPAALQDALRREGPAALAEAARAQGDPDRGARVLFRAGLACLGCHAVAGVGPTLGPDLARLGPDARGAHLVESLLDPSRAIRPGYESITLALDDGSVLAGLKAAETPDAITLRDPARGGQAVAVAKARVAERRDGGASVMPEGLVNALGSRQEFLDLVRLLDDLAAHPDRASRYRPDPAAVAPAPLPAYEDDLDHAGLLAARDAASYGRGERIYNRVCANCHGTKDAPGSLPTSLRFASGTFKYGNDPYRMYLTLTHGAGLMTAQSWMVPRQKYDVIHYIREAYLKPFNPSQYVPITPKYLAALPRGSGRGPEPSTVEPWSAMDYGPLLAHTFEIGRRGGRDDPKADVNFAFKGLAMRLDPGPGGVARGRAWAVFEEDTLRLAAAWTGRGFIDWRGIQFDGAHGVHPRIAGRTLLALPPAPGWADPRTGRFDDPRPPDRDGRRHGPLPAAWGRFLARYQAGPRTVLKYRVGAATILDAVALDAFDPDHPEGLTLARTLEVGPAPHALAARLAPAGSPVALVGAPDSLLDERDGFVVLHLPAGREPRRVKVLLAAPSAHRDALRRRAAASPPPEALEPLTHGGGGGSLWPETLTTQAARGDDAGPFAVDVLTPPDANPWNAQMRLTGIDFLPGPAGAAAVCTWDGDVWRVGGLDDPSGRLTWRRIASGLFQPLGLLVRDGAILVGCRDAIVRLRDADGDGETDAYEIVNTDHQVTEHFHEFAMGLQADAAGNLYYTKAARHALTAVVPQHGTLLRVAADGSRTDILATGFRAPNGVCPNPDGSFFLTDQEGHWIPKNRLNLVRAGEFHGNLFGYTPVTDPADAAMAPPVCWITNVHDRSPAEPLWITSPSWGALRGGLLVPSYGTGKLFLAPFETVAGVTQGAYLPLPVPAAPTGLVRGRFRPDDGHLYAVGMFAWAGDRTAPGGLYRVRATGQPMHLPASVHARRGALVLRFTDPLDPATAADASRYTLRAWNLERSANYGSPHVDEHEVAVRSAALAADRRTLTLSIPDLAPAAELELRYALAAPDGTPVANTAHLTIHHLAED